MSSNNFFYSNENSYSHHTAKDRNKLSYPIRILLNKKKIIGQILDYGCGKGSDVKLLRAKGFDINGFDPHYFPQKFEKKFDTIICNYVLNVLLPHEQINILMNIASLLKSDGFAYFTVRRDLKAEGFRIHYVTKKKTFQMNVILNFNSLFVNDFCEIYSYRHFNQLNNKSSCPFCSPSHNTQLITESNLAYSIFAIYPKSKGHSLIIPKSHKFDYFKISDNTKKEMWLMIDFVKNYLTIKYQTNSFHIHVNIGKKSGQKVNHAIIHLIPVF